jgi:hypothetical protein
MFTYYCYQLRHTLIFILPPPLLLGACSPAVQPAKAWPAGDAVRQGEGQRGPGSTAVGDLVARPSGCCGPPAIRKNGLGKKETVGRRRQNKI